MNIRLSYAIKTIFWEMRDSGSDTNIWKIKLHQKEIGGEVN